MVLAVIPARYGSTRFPGKPLALLRGKPVIQHVYEQVAKAEHVDEVVVATDDGRIREAIEQIGGIVAMTSASARSGTERVAEVARGRQAEVIINIQGDEPLVQPDMVDQVAQFLEAHAAVPMASLMVPLQREQDAANPNVVKVVVDRDGFAMYFSRATIPVVRHASGSRLKAQDSRERPLPRASSLPGPPGATAARPGSGEGRAGGAGEPRAWYKHIGLYGYQRHFLLQFPHLEPTPLEQFEQLEQLRALEHGYKIKLLETVHDTIGVDTPDDLAKVEELMAKSSELRVPS